MSVGLSDRLHFMESVAGALPRERLMVGTGACALADAAILTRAAFDLGYAFALVIPPFYFRDADDEGIVRFFDALFERAAPPRRSILLYNFPRMSGITFHGDLYERLTAQFPGIIRGLKDSSNTQALERELHERRPESAIFPGSEALLPAARESGLAGCISGTVCLWPQLASRAWHEGRRGDCEQVVALRRGLDGAPLIPAVRGRVARETGDSDWLRSVPPLHGTRAAAADV